MVAPSTPVKVHSMARWTPARRPCELQNENYHSILGLYWDNGQETGKYYSILGLYWDDGIITFPQ